MMTLQRAVSVTTFGADTVVTTTTSGEPPSDDRGYQTLPSTPKTPKATNYEQNAFSPTRPLDRTRSNQTFYSCATYSGLSRGDSINSTSSSTSVFQSQSSVGRSRSSVDRSRNSLSSNKSKNSGVQQSRNSVCHSQSSDHLVNSPSQSSFNSKFQEACNRRTPLTSTSSTSYANRKRSYRSEDSRVVKEESKLPYREDGNIPYKGESRLLDEEENRRPFKEAHRGLHKEYHRTYSKEDHNKYRKEDGRHRKEERSSRSPEDIERPHSRPKEESPTRSHSNSKGTKDSGVSHLNSTESYESSPSNKQHKKTNNCRQNVKQRDTSHHLNKSDEHRSSNTIYKKNDTNTKKSPTPENLKNREVVLEFPDSMPRSVGRTAARQLEKSQRTPRNASGQNTGSSRSQSTERDHSRLQSAKSMPGLNEVGRNRYRRDSGERSPKESKTCALWLIFKRKKKDNNKKSPSRTPDRHTNNSSSGTPNRHKSSKSSDSHQKVSRTPLYYQEYNHRERSSSPVGRSDRRDGSRGRVNHSVQHQPEDIPSSPSASSKAFKHLLTPSVHSSSHPPRSDRLYQPSTSSNRATADPQSTPLNHGSHTPKSRTHSVDHGLSRTDRATSHSPHATKRAIIKAASTPANLSEAARRQSRSETSLSQGRTGAGVSGYSSASNLRESEAECAAEPSGYNQRFDKYSRSRVDTEETSQASEERSRSEGRSRSSSLPSYEVHPSLYLADTKVITDAEDFVEKRSLDMSGPLHLSFCGCGFLGMYHLGVISTLLQRGGPLLSRVDKVGGASAGALIAALLVTAGDRVEEAAEHLQNLSKEIRRKPLGALTPGYSYTKSLRHMMEDILPDDAHRTARHRLNISLTNAQTKKNEIITDFTSREELLEALIASCYIPVYAGVKLPSLRGKKFMDGGLTDNLPRFESGRTITVSPFDGKTDICPKKGEEVEKKAHFITLHNQDIQVNMKNIKRGSHAFFPPKRGFMQDYFVGGRDDATRFLIREGLYEVSMPQKKPAHYESSV